MESDYWLCCCFKAQVRTLRGASRFASMHEGVDIEFNRSSAGGGHYS